jgi:hypothetical protein
LLGIVRNNNNLDEKRLSVKELYDALLENERSKASKVKSHSDIKRVKEIRIL